jgi:hypothetical protein
MQLEGSGYDLSEVPTSRARSTEPSAVFVIVQVQKRASRHGAQSTHIAQYKQIIIQTRSQAHRHINRTRCVAVCEQCACVKLRTRVVVASYSPSGDTPEPKPRGLVSDMSAIGIAVVRACNYSEIRSCCPRRIWQLRFPVHHEDPVSL